MSTTFADPTRRVDTLSAPALSTSTLTTFGQRVWAALEAHGQRRAAAHLRRMAALHADFDPELARRLSDAADQRPQA